MNRLLAALAMIPVLSTIAGADELKVISAGAVAPGMQAFAEVVMRETGHNLVFQFNTAPEIARRLAAGDAYDILIAPPDAITQASKDGKVVAETRVPVGRVGAGVVVRNGAPLPNVATTDALKQALLSADSVVYNTASTGIYLDKLFEKMGILEQLNPKITRYPDGAAVMEHVSRGKGNEIGFGAMTEIKAYEAKGVQLAGPLPPEVQNYTRYEAVMMSLATSPEAVKGVLKLLATPAGKAAIASGGIE